MSTHIDGLDTSHTAVTVTTNDTLAKNYSEYEFYEDDADSSVLALEAPGNCHLVVVEGDLEDFARRVWQAAFGDDADHTRSTPTEDQWEASERRRLGMTDSEWAEATIDEDWDHKRPVIVMWGDSQETPSQRLSRFHDELMEACNHISELENRHLDLIRQEMPESTKTLINEARILIGNDIRDMDHEYIRAQAELIAQVGRIPGFDDSDQMRNFVIDEITRQETQA